MPGRRIKREHDVRRCCKIQPAECQYRRCFKCELRRGRKPRAKLSGAECPRHLQLRDVAAIDLRKTRIVLTERIAAVVAPITVGGRLRVQLQVRAQHCEQRDPQCARPPDGNVRACSNVRRSGHDFIISHQRRRAHAVLVFLAGEASTAVPATLRGPRHLFGTRVPCVCEPCARAA